jgi:hypothetical protein
MGLDKLRLITAGHPKRSFFDALNADFRQPEPERKYVYGFQYRDRQQIEAINAQDEVRISTKPGVEPSVYIQLNFRVPGAKQPPQTVIELNPNRFENGHRGLCYLLEEIFFLKDALKISRLDLNADVEEISVQYFRDALRYPKKRKAGDIGEWRRRGTETLYVGRSPVRLRVYDKIQELMHHHVDVSSFPAVLTRIEWELRHGRWNSLPHTGGTKIAYFGDLPNLLRFQPFAKTEFLDVPAYDFENQPRESVNRLLFKTLAEKQGAHAAARILNKSRNFSRDFRDLLINKEDLVTKLQDSYLETTRLFFNNQGADVRFLYKAKFLPTKPHEIERYDYEIEDEDRIPREFLQPNDKALWNAVRRLGKQANIPGVRVIDRKE